MDKIIVNSVLGNKGSVTEAREVAQWFSTPEGALDLAQRLDEDWKEMNASAAAPAAAAPSLTYIRRIAAALVLLLMGALGAQLFIRFGQPNVEYQEVYAQKGEQIQVVLPDGTHVFLNNDSHIAFPTRFISRNRTIRLSGEAYFEVTKDKHHPFVVDLDGSSVEVLGTSFNVCAYARENVQVALDEGSVCFHSSERDVMLEPGEMLAYNRTSEQITLSRHGVSRMASAWKNHRIEVEDMPLLDLTNLLARRYDITFVVDDEACYQNTYSLSMSDRDLREVLKTMNFISPVRIRYDEENRVATIINQ